jgi:phosphopantothenoylcysteine decarboxylase/phosphopantothenate--cysteine ligase
VRVITNRSSGRQGYALAEVAHRLGAEVTLLSTVDLNLALDVVRGVEVVAVETAAELHEATMARADDYDAVIMAAAVADFTLKPSPEKLKRRDGVPHLQFEPTADIVADLVARRRVDQVIVAFAAESTDVQANALAKLRAKGVDVLVVNDVSAPGVGFEHRTNAVTIYGRDESATTVSLRSKEAISLAILTRVASLLSQGAQ